jgi:hypothetical protein
MELTPSCLGHLGLGRPRWRGMKRRRSRRGMAAVGRVYKRRLQSRSKQHRTRQEQQTCLQVVTESW